MALLNVLQTGAYSIIDNVFYAKTNSHLQFQLMIFTDSSKENLITSIPFQINGMNEAGVLEDINCTELPEEIEENKSYHISMLATGDLEAHRGKIVWYSANELQSRNTTGETVWVNEKAAYYKLEPAGPKLYKTTTKRDYDAYFSPALIESTGILGCCYEFVKQEPFVENALDV